MKHILIFLLSVIIPAAVAQSNFTFRQCIEYTTTHHPAMKVYENEVDIAKAKLIQTVSGYLPQVAASSTMINNLELQKSVLPAGIVGPEPTEVQFGTQYNTNAYLDINQTIYDQSKIAGIKANKPYIEITRLQQEQNEESLLYATANAYFQLLIYREQLAILQANRNKYSELVKVLQYQQQKGTALENDVDRIRVNLNTTEYQIEEATKKQQLALNSLKNAMGMDMSVELNITDSMNYELFAYGGTQQEFSLNQLTAVKINAQSLELQRLNLKSKQATYLPTLNAVGRFGKQSLNNDFSEAFSHWSNYSYIGLSLNVPLFSGFRRKSVVKEEHVKLLNEELNFLINKQKLQLAFDNAATSVVTAYTSFRSNRDNMKLAQKLLNVTDYQYRHGVASLTNYLNDDAAYKAAQGNYINSLYNLIISQLNFQKSQGTLSSFLESIQ